MVNILKDFIIFCTDPTKWSEVAETCGGRAQSPINIVTKRAQLDESLKPLQYTDYQKAFHSDIINNGHSGKSEILLLQHIFIHNDNLSLS